MICVCVGGRDKKKRRRKKKREEGILAGGVGGARLLGQQIKDEASGISDLVHGALVSLVRAKWT